MDANILDLPPPGSTTTIVQRPSTVGSNKRSSTTIATTLTGLVGTKQGDNAMLQHAIQEKENARQTYLETSSQVLVITPVGKSLHSKSKTTDYRVGTDTTVDILACSLRQHGFAHDLMLAEFDDTGGYASLTTAKIQAVHRVVRELLYGNHPPHVWPETTLILVVDGFDVIVQTTPQQILEEYHNQPHPIVFGGDTFCWDPVTENDKAKNSTIFCSLPDQQRQIMLQRHDQRKADQHWYLNSGMYASTLGTLVRFLDVATNPFPTRDDGLMPLSSTKTTRNTNKNGTPPPRLDAFRDQAYWSYWYVRYHPLVGLDAADKSFMANMNKKLRSGLRFGEGVFYFKPKSNTTTTTTNMMGTIPALIHFPGKEAKVFMVYGQGKKYYRTVCGL